MSARELRASAWVERCLGRGPVIRWGGEQTVAAVAAANLLVDGKGEVPATEVSSYAPARQFEVAWAVALALREAGRDAAALIDQAFGCASAIAEPFARDHALLWGALALGGQGGARWAAGVQGDDFRRELAAHQVRIRAEGGDLAGARRALAALPGIWGLRSDHQYWYGYPRWLGSAAVAAGVALASPAVASDPAARALVEEAERSSANIEQEWRQNRELRALGLAWARVGDSERAFATMARMPGSERCAALIELVSLLDDSMPSARIEELARRALAATGAAPFILAAPGVDRAELAAAVGGILRSQLDGALARRRALLGDLRGADRLVAAIPKSDSARHEAALRVSCIRIARGEVTAAQVMAGVRTGTPFGGSLFRVAVDEGCAPIVEALIARAAYATNGLNPALEELVYQDRLVEAAALLRDLNQMYDPEMVTLVVHRMIGAGLVREALALFEAVPPDEIELLEQQLLVAGHMVVVGLATAGDADGARRLRDQLVPRLAAAVYPD